MLAEATTHLRIRSVFSSTRLHFFFLPTATFRLGAHNQQTLVSCRLKHHSKISLLDVCTVMKSFTRFTAWEGSAWGMTWVRTTERRVSVCDFLKPDETRSVEVEQVRIFLNEGENQQERTGAKKN